MPAWLRTLIKVVGFAWRERAAIRDAVDPEPKGTPLSYRDVERQRAQIQAATTKLKE